MSVQAQRVRANASPGSAATKQVGPMRATLPVSLMKQGSPTRLGIKPTPTNSPPIIWPVDGSKSKASKSPDNNRHSSPERRSPDSPNFKGGKSKTLNPKTYSQSPMRRAGSLDTLYLHGHWPKDFLPSFCATLVVDKSTQTPDEWNELVEKRKNLAPRSASMANGDQLDKFRARLQRSKDSNRQTMAGVQRHSPNHGTHTFTINSEHVFQSNQSRPMAIPSIPKSTMPRTRNSVEGLNQEIERLFIRRGISGYDDDLERIHEPTPDGHRAPVPDLLRSTRTVNTQTPSEVDISIRSARRCHSMSPPFPIISGVMDNLNTSSQNELDIPRKQIDDFCPSPDPDIKLGSSPNNKFLTREPPDGCERVKMIEEPRLMSFFTDPLKPRDSFILQPSQGSAFCPLRKGYLSISTQETIAVALPAARTTTNATVIEGQ
uniref:Glucocorticoid-induced transcript 1 protein n=1 Tax=Strigamia maritima TaxID=126957 RepID=T1JD76_STRMM